MESVAETKVCKKCGVERKIDRFALKHGRTICKDCWNARVRRYKAIKRGVPQDQLPSGRILPAGFKCCRTCFKVLPVAEFTKCKLTRDGLQTRCKQCYRSYARAYDETIDPEKKRRKRREYYLRNEKGNPNRKRAPREWYRNWKLETNYGITLAQYNEMLAVQGNVCALCGSEFAKDKGRFPVVDHDHSTGAIRGIIHRNCNLGLGLLGDTSDAIEKALAYLRR